MTNYLRNHIKETNGYLQEMTEHYEILLKEIDKVKSLPWCEWLYNSMLSQMSYLRDDMYAVALKHKSLADAVLS